jgi:hypothetical protein
MAAGSRSGAGLIPVDFLDKGRLEDRRRRSENINAIKALNYL